jgi:hypothetical protein
VRAFLHAHARAALLLMVLTAPASAWSIIGASVRCLPEDTSCNQVDLDAEIHALSQQIKRLEATGLTFRQAIDVLNRQVNAEHAQ